MQTCQPWIVLHAGLLDHDDARSDQIVKRRGRIVAACIAGVTLKHVL